MASSPPVPSGLHRPHGITTATTPGRELPWLLAYNRKVRNLESLSLRNLNLDLAFSGRPRGKTIDDDALPNTLVSPAKLRALHKKQTLGHSRSSADLRRKDRSSARSADETFHTNGAPVLSNATGEWRPYDPRPSRPRRRSTLDWANAGSGKRQEKLERMIEDRLADVFFSVHVDGVEEPVYVSETVERTMNPTFRALDLDHCDAAVLRQDSLTIRVWTRHSSVQHWRTILALTLSLASVRHLGETLEDIDHPLQQNAVLFHFPDGIFTTLATVLSAPGRNPASLQRNGHLATRQRCTSPFDALLRLSKLTDSIGDALATRQKLVFDLSRLLEAHKQALDERDRVDEAADRLQTIKYAKITVSKQLDKARRQIDEKRAALSRRRELMSKDGSTRVSVRSEMLSRRDELPHLRDDREIRKKAIAAQRRRIAEDILKIFPINPAESGKALSFRIRTLRLPNSEDLDSVSAAALAAALGFVAQVTQLVSLYLEIPLLYPVNPLGSASFISDPISLIKGHAGPVVAASNSAGEDRRYPLHLHRVARFRFEYAVFLLNKDVQLLLESGFGVRVLDIRHTLPNLKYLLYVATAGEGELPARKAGGIRGLTGQMPGTGPIRKASTESTGSFGSVGGWTARGKTKEEAGHGKRAAESLRVLAKS